VLVLVLMHSVPPKKPLLGPAPLLVPGSTSPVSPTSLVLVSSGAVYRACS